MMLVSVAELIDRGGAELVTGPFGTQLAAHQYVDEGTPVINVRNVGFGDVRTSDLEYLDDATVERLGRHRLKEGDIVFGRKGAVERHAFISSTEDGWMQGSDCIRLRLDREVIEPRFVSFAFRTQWHKRWMQNHCSFGATMASLNQDILRLVEIPAPPLQVQREIVRVLGAFDDLIENNRRRIEMLEEMARLIYREWFVEFRFPDHEYVQFVDSDLGRIPKGWERVNVFDLADVGFGFAFKSQQFAEAGPFPVVRIRDIPNGATQTFTDEEAGDRYLIRDGDILIGMDGDFHMCRWASGTAYLNQRVARIRTAGPLSQYHLSLALEQPIRDFNDSIIGTTVAHLGKRHLQEIEIVVPTDNVLEAATVTLQPMFDLEIALRKQNRVLSETRDLLLPRLISGELDVSDLDLDLDGVA